MTRLVLLVLALVLADLGEPTSADPAPRETASSRCSSVPCVVHQVFGLRAPAALRVAWCESRWNPRAVSPTDDHGLFQINRHYHRWAFAIGDIYDARWNARVAYALSDSGTNWQPWTCRWAA